MIILLFDDLVDDGPIKYVRVMGASYKKVYFYMLR